MSESTPRVKISTLLNIAVAGAFVTVAILFIFMVNREQREQALLQAESKARVMLDHNLATHTHLLYAPTQTKHYGTDRTDSLMGLFRSDVDVIHLRCTGNG